MRVSLLHNNTAPTRNKPHPSYSWCLPCYVEAALWNTLLMRQADKQTSSKQAFFPTDSYVRHEPPKLEHIPRAAFTLSDHPEIPLAFPLNWVFIYFTAHHLIKTPFFMKLLRGFHKKSLVTSTQQPESTKRKKILTQAPLNSKWSSYMAFIFFFYRRHNYRRHLYYTLHCTGALYISLSKN